MDEIRPDRLRKLLERSTWRLRRGSSVTDAGLEAGYGSTEAFSRAFSRAYGVPPGKFGDVPRDFRLLAPNGIHFHAPDGLWPTATGFGREEGAAMDLTDRLIEHDHWLTGRTARWRSARIAGRSAVRSLISRSSSAGWRPTS
ncbi:hypothetical protein [Kribbella sp. HUAS MG21]|uniref:HTH araC/xylS-type domain-containing protein n=1 Tax=Kribbella sp. HUAS MG21 TaxID=3160966 RepID=A0AAU7T7F8_9ACTN